ncbi:hypothetical protein K502DRAFT_346052 [Neoconidiobolus thromboides FSU 785]|nr:hypothetical protein K502DRAFT_346052 [Neoconidiobolus thromboides FSU 785]
MQYPTPRGNKEFYGYCSRGWGCKTACDSMKSDSPYNQPYTQKKIVRRGEKLTVSWLRQNHPGGFVRLAIVPMANSDDLTAFDNNIVKYVCYETNCKESSHDPMLGDLNGPGSTQCTTDLIIPNNLPDGPITLQWTWFGGGVLYADKEAAFANYVSCSDMLLQGGQPYSYAPVKAIFQGGDVANPHSNQCRYWSSNHVNNCPDGAEDKDNCGYGPAKNGTPGGY